MVLYRRLNSKQNKTNSYVSSPQIKGVVPFKKNSKFLED